MPCIIFMKIKYDRINCEFELFKDLETLLKHVISAVDERKFQESRHSSCYYFIPTTYSALWRIFPIIKGYFFLQNIQINRTYLN